MTHAPSTPRDHARERGQVIVIFAGGIVLFMLLLAVVVDISWYWANTLRVQRAADAAALAGAVLLPGKVDTGSDNAYLRARNEAKKNGYTTGGGVFVTPEQDSRAHIGGNPNQLNVTIQADVPTFFMRVIGISSITAMRASKAEYVLPVPMGSPQNYYGVGFLRDAIDTTTTTYNTSNANNDTGWGFEPTTVPPSGQWTPSSGTIEASVQSNDTVYATEDTDDQRQRWNAFGLATTAAGSPIPNPAVNQGLTIRGIEVRLRDTFLSGSCSNSRVRVELSWDIGFNWTAPTTPIQTGTLDTSSSADYTLGSATNIAVWGSHPWVRADFTDANFQVRLTFDKGCTTAGRMVLVDMLETRVYWQMATTTATTTTTTNIEPADVRSPYGDVLAPQNFWGAMQSQGAPNIQGDAYMTKYQSRSGPQSNPNYGWDEYYNYGVEIPAGATNGEVWIFDPGHCDATSTVGTGEYWTVGSPNGASNREAISAFFDLYDTKGTPYNTDDDGSPIASSGDDFKRISYEDYDIFAEVGNSTHVNDCSDLAWHYDANWQGNSPATLRRGWYLLASGLSGGTDGRTYRLHSYSTDRGSLSDQNNATALNAFAFYSRATGGTPRVYGLGSMEAYVRLPGGKASEFYLAQIDAVHAGKTMVVRLWDPGDTTPLRASLEILQPGTTSYTPASFTWTSQGGTTDGNQSNCDNKSGSGTAVVTHTGGNSSTYSQFNGCWLEMEIAIPATYSAPHPSSDTVTSEAGWWKIRYTMGGSASSFSTDLTTWEVNIRGNPVHLKVP